MTENWFKVQGDQLYMHGKYYKAIKKYEKALEANPSNALFYYCKGLCYKKLKFFEKAISEFDKAISFNSDDYLNHKNKGISLKNIKKYQDAIAEFDIAIKINPNDPSNFNNKGNTLYEMEKYEEALAEYNKAIIINPKKYIYYINKGNVYYDIKNYENALDEYIKAIRFSEENLDGFGVDKIKSKIVQITTENLILKDKIELYKNMKEKIQFELENRKFKIYIYYSFLNFLINKIIKLKKIKFYYFLNINFLKFNKT